MSDTLGTIGQLAISVNDISLQTAFYRDALSLPFLFEVPNMAFFDCDGVRLMLAVPEEEGETGNSILYFKVDDLETEVDRLREKAVNFISEPHRVAQLEDHELWMAFFQDPEGNTLALMSEVR